MRYDKVRRNPKQLLSLTGFIVSEFEAFVPTFRHHWDEYYSHFTLKGKPRERISYNRKSSQLPLIADKLLFILSYLKNNPLQEYHGATYGMTQPQCNEWVHRLSDILLKTLKTLGELPDRNHLRVQYLLDKCNDVLLDGCFFYGFLNASIGLRYRQKTLAQPFYILPKRTFLSGRRI